MTLNLVLAVHLGDDLLLLLHRPQVLLPARLLHAVLVVQPRLQQHHHHTAHTALLVSCLEAVGVEGLEGVQALVGPVRPPVPPDAGRPGELGDDPRHFLRFTLKLQISVKISCSKTTQTQPVKHIFIGE